MGKVVDFQSPNAKQEKTKAQDWRYFCLNPKKGRRFTTKGINLTLTKPVGAVPPDLPEEFMARIRAAISEGLIFEVSPTQVQGIKLQGQAQVAKPEDNEERVAGSFTSDVEEEVLADGRVRRKVTGYTITMPDEDGNVSKDEEGQPRSSIILTGIESEHDEE